MTEENPAAPEIEAIGVVHNALRKLETASQLRVIQYVAGLLQLSLREIGGPPPREERASHTEQAPTPPPNPVSEDQSSISADEEGISPVALKWMRRSGFDAKSLQQLFSLGIDEIDLVAKTIPGKGAKARMRNVMLLQGIAAYLSSGVARMTYEKVKEACVHYSAYDQANFASYVKAMSSEIGGSKESGYTLTARGISEATDLIKSMLTG